MNKHLRKYSQSDIALAIGVVLTEKTNAGDMNARDIVALGRHPHTGFFGKLKKHDNEIVDRALEAVGMAHKAKQRLSGMSDGERQKVMIAKALSQECPIVILDEPTAFLDVASRIETMILLRRLAKEQNKAILISTHDMEQAIQMGDIFWLLKENTPLVCGSPEDLILSGKINTFFEKNDISFNSYTGKLTVSPPTLPIGIEGEPLAAYWLGNALVRNQYKPAPPDDTYPTVNCLGSNEFVIIIPGNATPLKATSISDVLAQLRIET